jgi:hypothetical protein
MRARIPTSKFLILNSVLAASISTAACRESTPKTEPATGLKSLTLTLTKGARPVAGAEVNAVAVDLPPHGTVDLMWETVDGGWVVEDGYRFRGKRFTDSSKVLGRAQVDAAGRLETHFNIPEDFGGMHAVTVADAGKPLAQGGIEVTQTFSTSIHPKAPSERPSSFASPVLDGGRWRARGW